MCTSVVLCGGVDAGARGVIPKDERCDPHGSRAVVEYELKSNYCDLLTYYLALLGPIIIHSSFHDPHRQQRGKR